MGVQISVQDPAFSSLGDVPGSRVLGPHRNSILIFFFFEEAGFLVYLAHGTLCNIEGGLLGPLSAGHFEFAMTLLTTQPQSQVLTPQSHCCAAQVP